MDFSVDENMLREFFSSYGVVEYVRVVRDLKGKSKGYGFVEFKRKEEFVKAFRDASGKRIKGKRIHVDAEYGRTKRKFRPMRLGGGLGKSRKSKNHPYPLERNKFRIKK